MNVLDRIALAHGRLSDLRAVWWPFLFLMPAHSSEVITQRKILVMIPCFAAWFLLAWVVKEWIFRDSGNLSIGLLVKMYAYFLVGFLIWFNLVTAPLWNRRVQIISDRNKDGVLNKMKNDED